MWIAQRNFFLYDTADHKLQPGMVIVICNKKQIRTEDSPLHSGMTIQVWITDVSVHWLITDDHKVAYEIFFSGSTVCLRFMTTRLTICLWTYSFCTVCIKIHLQNNHSLLVFQFFYILQLGVKISWPQSSTIFLWKYSLHKDSWPQNYHSSPEVQFICSLHTNSWPEN